MHKGFRTLDTVAHTLTSLEIANPADVHIVDPATLPNRNWLAPGLPSAGQQGFGDALLAAHKFVLLPSAVSPNSWNLVFVRSAAIGAYSLRMQQAFALDPRLHPPATHP